MSRRSSTGDLVPRDITEILALESKRKTNRGSSLGRAFSWLRTSKRKKSVSNGQSCSGSLGGRTGENTNARHGPVNQDSSKVGQKQDEQRKLTVHYTASQLYQENVFIESSRPKYLQDLHSEAQKGLKILQQEAEHNGVEFEKNHTNSAGTPQEETDASGLERDGLLGSNSTADLSTASISPGPAVSSRPVLTRQGSTFKPLNTVKRPDKTKKRSRRTTIMGIPHQVQRELYMDKGVLAQQLPHGEDDDDGSSGTVVIPTIDGGMPITDQEGARVHLQNIEALLVSRDEQLLMHHLQSVYRDDVLMNYRLAQRISSMQRPKSLAVPGMTTSTSILQDTQGPVMSISPQATYLSTIIPNAVLPAAIDVIKIDRSHSRQSMRAVSKNSLASSSPSSSRSGTNDKPTSSSYKQSHSKSSDTVVSNSSTISVKGNTPPSHLSDSMKEVSDLNQEEQMSLKSSASWLSSTSKAPSEQLEQGEMTDTGENTQNSQLSSRSLSVIKTKLPPTPPRRSYSLHHGKLNQRSKQLLDSNTMDDAEPNAAKEHSQITNNEIISTSFTQSTFLDDSAVTSSPDQHSTGTQTSDLSPLSQFERTMSPSSGYSSQSGTPTHSSKDICPSSPGKLITKPPKPERMGARSSPVVSISSSIASLSSSASDQAHQHVHSHTSQPQPSPPITTEANKTRVQLREQFIIPPPPRIKAPCPPPPETWTHNKRTFELLCGPGPKLQRQYELQKNEPLVINQNTDNSDPNFSKSHVSVEMKLNLQSEDDNVLFEAKNEPAQEQLIQVMTLASRKTESPMSNVKEHTERENADHAIQTQEPTKEALKMDQESPTAEKAPLAGKVHQKSLTQKLKTDYFHLDTSGLQENSTSVPKSEGADIKGHYCIDKEILNNAPTQNPVVTANSPPPSPPPAHHPPPPPSKNSPEFSVSTSPPEENVYPKVEEDISILESSWPPPPPPLEELPDLVFEVQDETDFPPPPPPLSQESLSDTLDNCNMESTGLGDNVTPGETSEAPHKDNVKQENSEAQIIENTETQGKNASEPPSTDCTLDVQMSDEKTFNHSHANASQVSVDLVHSTVALTESLPQVQKLPLQSLIEEISPIPPDDTQNPPITRGKCFSGQTTSDVPKNSTNVPVAPPLQLEDMSTVNFKRQPSLLGTDKDIRSKDLLPRNKSAPTPKEDANIPLVTPSLLQMVRLRSVTVEDQDSTLSQDGKAVTVDNPEQAQCISSQVVPQKPIRKACLKSTQPSVSSPATVLGPSMRLQEAIRMKTAAMSSSGVPAALRLRLPSSSTNSNDMPVLSPNALDGSDLNKSPASTASFIFSKSTKKVVIETATSPEAQASLKQNLAAELMQISDQAKSTVSNGTRKSVKVPPPVAKKPAHATSLSETTKHTTTYLKEDSSRRGKNGLENNGQISLFAVQEAQSQESQVLANAGSQETASALSIL